MGQLAGAAYGALLTMSSLPMASSSPSPSLSSAVFHVPHDQYRHHHRAALASLAAAVSTGLVQQQNFDSLHLRRGGTLPLERRKRRLSSFFCSGRSSWDSVSLCTTAITSCCGICLNPLERLHSCSTSSSGLSNPRVSWSIHRSFGSKLKMTQDRLHLRKVEVGGGSTNEDFQDHGQPIGTRKVLEHIVLFKMQDSLTDEQEKDMLDSLWSLQYQIKNILCTTVGRLVKKTPEGYTHALFSRFPTKQAVEEYMESPIRWRVAQDLVIPFYNGLIMVDFEADVEDDIETIFRRGDDFQEGFEHIVFFKFKDHVSSDVVDEFLKTANGLPAKYGNLVQLTVGKNFHSRSKEIYSHALVARLPSEEAHEEFEKYLQSDPNWVEATELYETLVANFVVSPVGKTVM